MRFELCKQKTKCKNCGKIMNEEEIRGVYGQGYYSNPFVYYCLKCSKKEEININSLISLYKQIIRNTNKKINNLKKIRSKLK